MSDQCCSNPMAGSEVCELPMTTAQRASRVFSAMPLLQGSSVQVGRGKRRRASQRD